MTSTSRDVHASDPAGTPYAIDPSGLIALYFTEPSGVLLRLVQPTRGTTEMAAWLAGPGLEQVFARFAGATDLRVILDMRQLTGRSASARALLLQAGIRSVGRVGHVVLVPSLHLGSAYLKVVEAGAAVLRVAGLRVDVVHDLEAVLAEHGVQVLGSDRRIPTISEIRPAVSVPR